ncbi:hypothetical protein [Teredinibacter turnerae]
MKTHIGIYSLSKFIHLVIVNYANVHDSRVLGDLLHGDESRGYGDSFYTG